MDSRYKHKIGEEVANEAPTPVNPTDVARLKDIPVFTPIAENQYGTHPAFNSQHELNVWLLTNFNGGGTAPTLTVSNITHEAFDYQITE